MPDLAISPDTVLAARQSSGSATGSTTGSNADAAVGLRSLGLDRVSGRSSKLCPQAAVLLFSRRLSPSRSLSRATDLERLEVVLPALWPGHSYFLAENAPLTDS